MRSKVLLSCLAVLLVLASATSADARDMSLTTGYSDKHPTIVNCVLPWMAKVKEATKGEIVLSYYNPGTICPEAEIFTSIAAGVVDFGANSVTRVPGRYPLASVLDLPNMAGSAEGSALAGLALYEKYPALQKELSENKVLWFWAGAPYQFHMTKKEVKNLAGLKGLRIITWNKMGQDIVRSLGASPISIPPIDTYMSLQRGMADGVFCPNAPIRSFKIDEVCKYHFLVNVGASNFVFVAGISSWNSLTPEQQKAVMSISGAHEMTPIAARTLDDGSAADRELLTKNGHVFHEMPAEDAAVFPTFFKGFDEAWLADMKKAGHGEVAEAFLKDAREFSKKFTKEAAARRAAK